jgi:iron(III) transport system ATP-binding protein
MAGAGTATGTAAALDVVGAELSFGPTPVLRGVDLSVPAGSLVALLGPSGCGKTTLLRVVAGLERADAGTVMVGDRVLSGPGTDVPPERRRVGMVFQDWALFPHLTVARNVAYGLPRGPDRDARVAEALTMVGLGSLADRQPGTLSGGQQQRVALARALAPQPSVLLLDEPFSNLDTALRVQVRSEVHALLVELGITTVLVTHDQDEAFVLGDEVAVMRDGLIVQRGVPAEIYRRPADTWVAAFVGQANLVPGVADGEVAATPVGGLRLDAPATGDVEVLVRPESLRLDAPVGAGGHGDGVVELVEYYGHDTVYVVDVGDVRVRVRDGEAPAFRRGDRVSVRTVGDPSVAYCDGLVVEAAVTPAPG